MTPTRTSYDQMFEPSVDTPLEADGDVPLIEEAYTGLTDSSVQLQFPCLTLLSAGAGGPAGSGL